MPGEECLGEERRNLGGGETLQEITYLVCSRMSAQDRDAWWGMPRRTGNTCRFCVTLSLGCGEGDVLRGESVQGAAALAETRKTGGGEDMKRLRRWDFRAAEGRLRTRGDECPLDAKCQRSSLLVDSNERMGS